MAQQGATLQSINNEMVTCIEDLRQKREEVNSQILVEEEERIKVQNDLHILTERLARINESVSRKMATREEFDRTISETESAYMKVYFVNKYIQILRVSVIPQKCHLITVLK